MKIFSIKNISLLIALIGVACLTVFFFKHNIGLTDDSGYYVYASKFHFLKDIKGNPLVTFAPLYPVILSASNYLKIDIYLFVFLFNALCWIITMLLAGSLIDKNISHKYIKIIALLSIGAGIPVLMNIFFLWSDVLGIVLVLSLIHYINLYQKKLSLKYLIYIIILSCLCFYQRYATLGIIAGATAYLIFFTKASLLRRIIVTLSYIIPTAVICSVWFIRNSLLNKRQEDYGPAILNFTENLCDTFSTFSTYLLPDEIPLYIRAILFIFLIPVLLYHFRTELGKILEPSITAMLLCITGVYLLFLTVLNSIRFFTPPDERILSPVYILTMIAFFILADKIYSTFRYQKLFIIVLSVWLIYPLTRTIININNFLYSGLGYHNVSWKRDDIIHYLNSRIDQQQILSNNPIPIILLTNTDAVCIPEKPELTENRRFITVILWDKETRLSYTNFKLEEYLKYYNFIHRYQGNKGHIYAAIRK
jgi:hypothetical protein